MRLRAPPHAERTAWPVGEVSDAVNQLTVFMVVRADSPEAAARLFEGHPHMSIFVCDGVEVMPALGN